MAAGDITRGSRTAIPNIANLDSGVTNGVAETFGEIDVGTSGAIAINLHFKIDIAASSAGTYTLYLLESQDGAEWTDDIDPTADVNTDVAAKLADAKHLRTVDATYDATNRLNAEFHVGINLIGKAGNIGFVLLNNSGQTIGAGCDGDYQLQTVS